MPSMIGLVALIAIAALLVWSSIRACRVKNKILKWSSVGLTALLAMAISLISAVAVAGMVKMNSRSAPVPILKVAGTPEQVERGRAIATSFCAACHSRTGQFTGGVDFGKDFPTDVGSFVSANLTPAGPLAHWSDGEIFRAIRNGIDADGHWLVFMSDINAGKLSDEDIQAVIAYLRTLPAAGQPTVTPPDRFTLLGTVMLGAGMLPEGKPVFTGRIAAPPKGPTLQYGEYILSFQDCRLCHGADLNGGVQGQRAPVGPNLSVVAQWKLQDFIATLRTGIDPYGHELGANMPWRAIGKMDDEELAAIYAYLTRTPASENAREN